MDLQTWVIELLEEIRQASLKDENFGLSLNRHDVKEIAEAYDKATWIEIN
jgi:hypothetical protein